MHSVGAAADDDDRGPGAAHAGAAAEHAAALSPAPASRPGTTDSVHLGPLIGVSKIEHLPVGAEPCPLCSAVPGVGDTVRRLPCHHCFHDKCLSAWMDSHSRVCPTCGVSADGAAQVDRALTKALGVAAP